MNLDRRIELHQKVTTRNSSGQYLSTYTLHSTVYAAENPITARVNPMSAGEDNSGAQLYEYRIVRWVIRTHASVQHDWRVIHNGEEFEIIGILPNGRRTYQTLICKYRDNEQ